MIITTQRHPFNSWLDKLLTLAGWFVFSYLVAQGLWLLLRHSMSSADFEQIDPIFPTLTTFLLYGLVLGLNALLLFGWSRWHQRAMPRGGVDAQRLTSMRERPTSSLQFAEKHIDTVRNSQVVVLYHSQDGAVADVKPAVSNQPRQYGSCNSLLC